jgi:hypothetical protein
VAIVLFSLAKDIVDSDIETDGGGPAAGAAVERRAVDHHDERATAAGRH